MNKTAWILLALAGLTALVMAYGAVGRVVAVLGSITFFIGLDQFYRWRSSRLAQSMDPGEVLLAAGLVSEETFDETAAVLVRDYANRYRLLVADKRGAAPVASVTPTLARHSSPYDHKSYIELQTPKGTMHFAPRKGLLLFRQSQHAQEVLDVIVAMPPSGQKPNGA